MSRLTRLWRASLLKIPGIGIKYAAAIGAWQKRAHFSRDVAWVGDMIQEDAARNLELNRQIKALDGEIGRISSDMARCLRSLPGFGPVCTAELAGEIGSIQRFRAEGSLGLYLGMANLDRSSGTVRGSKAPKHVDTRGPRRR